MSEHAPLKIARTTHFTTQQELVRVSDGHLAMVITADDYENLKADEPALRTFLKIHGQDPVADFRAVLDSVDGVTKHSRNPANPAE